MLGLAKLTAMIAAVALAAVLYLSQRMESAANPKAAPAPPAMPVAKPVRAAPPPASGGSVTLLQDAHGHHKAQIEIGGRRIAMLVDTGASFVSLSHEDARTAGILPLPGDYTLRMNTANGVAMAAKVRLSELRLDTIVMRDVEAVVMPQGAMAGSLLGMSFLKRLGSFQFESGRLVLRP